MLRFFHKYQKYFLVVVAFFIIVSFVFFGTFNAMSRGEKEPNWAVGQLVDGSVLMRSKLRGMTRLLQGGIEEGGRGMNLLNGSIVHKEIILGGQGEMLATAYFDTLLPELKERWKRMKRYSPYVHPYAPAISAKSVWSQFAPEIIALLRQVQEGPAELTLQELPVVFALYRAQAKLPPHMLHQMLYFQEKHGGQVRPDPALSRGDFALFGFGSIEDWFGTQYLDLVSQFVLNTACLAKQEGYHVSPKEAQFDLYLNVENGLKAYHGEDVTSEQVHKYYTYGIRSLGVDEKKAIALWQEVLLYRSFASEVKGAVMVDHLALDQFKKEAKSTFSVRTFRLPEVLQLSTFHDMLSLQCYLEAVSKGDPLRFPPDLRTAEEVKEEHPELVAQSFDVKIAQVTQKEVASRVPLKKSWEWELQEANFLQLQQEFPVLAVKRADTEQARVEALEKLDAATRFQVDQFARLALVEANPSWIGESLGKAAMEKKVLQVPLKGEGPFAGEAFIALLQDKAAALSCYTVDGATYYQIEVVGDHTPLYLFSYQEAVQRGIVEKMLDEMLAAAYPHFSFRKPFEEVKDQLGARLYKDLLLHIEQASGQKWDELDAYARHRFDDYLKEMRARAKEGQSIADTTSPWALQVSEEEQAEVAASLQVGEFSPVEQGRFFQLLAKVEGSASAEEIARVQRLLAADAERVWMDHMVKQMQENASVCLHE